MNRDFCLGRGSDEFDWSSEGQSVSVSPVAKSLRVEVIAMCASPEYTPLNDVDRAILQLLQRDARHLTAVDIAEKVGVSDGTVRNRIRALEERDIIEGHRP